MVRVSVIAAALIAISAGAALAQEAVMVPLADVARQAEAAKATVKKAKKTYTNSSLSADPRGETAAGPATAPVPPVAAVAGKADGKPAAATVAAAAVEAPAEGEPQKESEEAWRGRANALRMHANRNRERLSDLNIPNQYRDENPGVKAANDVEIAKMRAVIDGLRKQWERLEASAVERKIPIAWIQPAPEFPQ